MMFCETWLAKTYCMKCQPPGAVLFLDTNAYRLMACRIFFYTLGSQL